MTFKNIIFSTLSVEFIDFINKIKDSKVSILKNKYLKKINGNLLKLFMK